MRIEDRNALKENVTNPINATRGGCGKSCQTRVLADPAGAKAVLLLGNFCYSRCNGKKKCNKNSVTQRLKTSLKLNLIFSPQKNDSYVNFGNRNLPTYRDGVTSVTLSDPTYRLLTTSNATHQTGIRSLIWLQIARMYF